MMTKQNKTIVIIVILAVTLGFFEVQNTEAGLLDFLNFSNIPKHPLLEKVEERQSIINGEKTKTIIYRAGNNADVYNIIGFYKDMLMQRGWTKSQEYLSPDYGIVGFTDDEMRVFTLTITRSPLREGVIAKVFYMPGGQKKWIFKDNPQDSNDMPGKDLDWLPRYPGANRVNSVEDYTGVTTIQYLIPGYSCSNCAVQFYREHMINNGWQFIGTSYQDKDQIQQAQANRISRTKDIMKDAISRLKKKGMFNDEILERHMASYEAQGETQQPSEVYSLHFEKNGDVCAIGITYTEGSPAGANMVVEQVEKALQASKEMGGLMVEGEPIEEYFSRIRPLYYQRLMEKESITISVVYTPKGSRYSSSKRVGFRMRGAR
ncbi:hypothetical protein ACFL2Y_05365 [Candidatus Omnitrophota bacterium]